MARQELDLSTLQKGSSFQLTLGSQDIYQYQVHIVKEGKCPTAIVIQTQPKGASIPTEVVLEGTGFWTTPEQNPTQAGDTFLGKQRQEQALTIGYGRIRQGGFVVISDPANPTRRIYLEPRCGEINIL